VNAADSAWLDYLRKPTPEMMRRYSTIADREAEKVRVKREVSTTFKDRWNVAYETAIARGYCDVEAAKHANIVAGAAIRTFEDQCDDAKTAMRDRALAS